MLNKWWILLFEIKYVFLTHVHDDHAGFLNGILEKWADVRRKIRENRNIAADARGDSDGKRQRGRFIDDTGSWEKYSTTFKRNRDRLCVRFKRKRSRGIIYFGLFKQGVSGGSMPALCFPVCGLLCRTRTA